MSIAEPEQLIYRDEVLSNEVLSIIGALAEIVVERAGSTSTSTRTMKRKRTKEERERMRQRAENHPRVRELRALEAKGRAELEARRKAQEQSSA